MLHKYLGHFMLLALIALVIGLYLMPEPSHLAQQSVTGLTCNLSPEGWEVYEWTITDGSYVSKPFTGVVPEKWEISCNEETVVLTQTITNVGTYTIINGIFRAASPGTPLPLDFVFFTCHEGTLYAASTAAAGGWNSWSLGTDSTQIGIPDTSIECREENLYSVSPQGEYDWGQGIVPFPMN